MQQVKVGIGKKFLVLNSAIVIASSLLLGVIFFYQAKQLLVENELKDLTEDVHLYNSKFLSQLRALEENVILVSKTPPVQGIIRAGKNNGVDPADNSTSEEWKKRLTHIFDDFLYSKPSYISLRYIGVAEGGKEIVRVDKVRKSINITPEKNLQSNGQRPYFKETINLNKGQVYLSTFSLNREHGKVSLPHTPVLRAATPVYDGEANVFGIIIVNLDATQLFSESLSTRASLYLTDHNGYFLFHPNHKKTFGFDLGQEWKVQDEFPETRIFFDPEDPILEKTVYSFDSLRPRATHFAKLEYDPIDPDHFLGVAISENYDTLLAGAIKTLYKFVLLLVAVVLVSLVLVNLITSYLTEPLTRLLKATDDLASGVENVDFPIEASGEVGFLARSLKEMDRTVGERTSALAESEQQNRSITNNLVDGLVTISETGIIKTFNPAAERLFLYSKSEVVGENVSCLMPDPDRSAHDGYLKSYLRTGQAKIIGIGREVTGLRKDGTTFAMELAVSSVGTADEEGNYTQTFIGLCRNIEDRKIAELKIHRLSKVFDSSMSEIFSFDANTLKFVEVNRAAQRNLGYSMKELRQMTPLDLKPEFSLEDFDCLIKPLLNRETTGTAFQTVHKRKDGSVYPVHINLEYVTEGSGGIFFAITHDMTEEKEAEHKLLEAKEEAEQSKVEAQKANQAKSEFLSKMSHELRTPLNAILGFSQLEIMKGERSGNGGDAKRLGNIQQIQNSGEHLLELINEVLDLSRIETGTMSFSLEPINVNSLLDEIYSQCKSLGEQYEVSLIYNQQNDLDPVYINSDRTRLKQVLLNLLSNGIKYNKPGGVTQLVLQKFPGDTVRISIKDQGLGIAEDQVDRLFTPFDRLNAERTEIEGTGIGLAIVKQLTEAMGGKVGVESKASVGSEFYVEFSTIPAPAQEQMEPALESGGGLGIETPDNKQIKLLYIEDNPANVALITRLFDQFENIELHTAGEAVTGFKLLDSHSYDLILLDIHLPGMDGFEIFRHLSGDDKFKHIQVIALSAGATQSDIDKALDMGFHSYLTKPLDLSLVCKTITGIFAPH
ncbi:MAG: PAS domain S-box protein [Nitrospina sp.]|nr:PAS domain S-box protein [Nitrospina sp.]